MAVRGVTGTAIGAVAIAVPAVRASRGKIVDLLPALTKTVEDIRSDIIRSASPARRGSPVADSVRSLAFPHYP